MMDEVFVGAAFLPRSTFAIQATADKLSCGYRGRNAAPTGFPQQGYFYLERRKVVMVLHFYQAGCLIAGTAIN